MNMHVENKEFHGKSLVLINKRYVLIWENDW